MFHVTILEGDAEIRSQVLRQMPVSIGRASGNDLAIRHAYVSGRHGEIHVADGELHLKDLVSTNGTYLERGDSRLRLGRDCPHQIRLQDGDEIVLGRGAPVRLRVNLNTDVPPEVSPAPVASPTTATESESLLLVHDLSSSLHARQALQELLETFAASLLGVFRAATHVGVYLLRDRDQPCERVLTRSRPEAARYASLDPEVRGEVQARGTAILQPLPADGSGARGRGLAVALRHGKLVVGLVHVHAAVPADGEFDEQDLDVLVDLARPVAGPVANACVRAGVERSMGDLVRALEAKDPFTAGHSLAVAELARQVATALELPGDEVLRIERAALVANVGTVEIPYFVLSKKGRLTQAEHQLLQTHPLKSVQLMSPLRQMRDLVPLVRHHHERWDGAGYPDGLAGEAIPLGARIIALADTYCALVSPRSYRPARDARAAVAEMQRCAGAQLEPRLVDVLLRVLQDAKVERHAHWIEGADTVKFVPDEELVPAEC